MTKQLDCLFVSPNSAKEVYQDLADRWTAIEVPFWGCLLAESCRSQGFSVAILDCLAENLTTEQSVERIKEVNPRLVCFVTYGANPNAGTTQMVGTVKVAKLLRDTYPEFKIMSIGTYSSALPNEVLNYYYFDFVSYNEGVKCLHALLQTDLKTNLYKVPALGWKDYETGLNRLNPGPNSLVTTEEMDYLLPGYAWDLLPYKEKPLDLYRAHTWHALYQDEYRTPFASIYSSLGCRFGCEFCCINSVNRTDPTEGIHAANSSQMRFWSPEFMIKQFEILIEKYNCTTIRILDEMFVLNKKYYVPLCEKLRDRGYGKVMKSWVYSRVDTVNERFLDLIRDAGIQWLGLGIESSDRNVRLEISKGSFKDVDISEVVKQIKNHGLYAGCNYIFGLPDDTQETMQKTLDLSFELMGEFSNFYHCVNLPGSPLYYEAQTRGWKPYKNFEDYSFHSYEAIPCDTKYVKGEEVLRFRDEAWKTYFTNPNYHKLVLEKFGQKALNNIIEQTKTPLKRKILGD